MQPRDHGTAPNLPKMPPPGVFFGVALATAAFFALWSWLVFGQGEWIPAFDRRCADYWEAWSKEHRGLTGTMIFLTDMGGIAAMLLVAVMGAIWQAAVKNRRLALAWVLIVLSGGLLNMTTKSFFARTRPDNPDRVVHETNASYPSGHSMGSAIGYGMLGYALVRGQTCRRRRAITILLVIGIVLAVGFSRIYLRAHWFSDVIAGWTIGVCWLFFCLGWLRRYRRKDP